MFVRFNSGFLALTHFHICFLGCFHCKTLPHFSLRSYFKSLSARALAHNDDICKVFAPKIQFKIQFIFSFSRINKIYLNSSLYESVPFRRLTLKLKQIHKHHQHHRHHPKKRNRSWQKHHIIITHHCTCTIHRWKCERQKEQVQFVKQFKLLSSLGQIPKTHNENLGENKLFRFWHRWWRQNHKPINTKVQTSNGIRKKAHTHTHTLTTIKREKQNE